MPCRAVVVQDLRMGLPGTLVEYNQWLEQALAYKEAEGKGHAVHVMTLMGFLMVGQPPPPFPRLSLAPAQRPSPAPPSPLPRSSLAPPSPFPLE
jgi:hypothetical protein